MEAGILGFWRHEDLAGGFKLLVQGSNDFGLPGEL